MLRVCQVAVGGAGPRNRALARVPAFAACQHTLVRRLKQLLAAQAGHALPPPPPPPPLPPRYRAQPLVSSEANSSAAGQLAHHPLTIPSEQPPISGTSATTLEDQQPAAATIDSSTTLTGHQTDTEESSSVGGEGGNSSVSGAADPSLEPQIPVPSAPAEPPMPAARIRSIGAAWRAYRQRTLQEMEREVQAADGGTASAAVAAAAGKQEVGGRKGEEQDGHQGVLLMTPMQLHDCLEGLALIPLK